MKFSTLLLFFIIVPTSLFADICSIAPQALKKAEKIRKLKIKYTVPCLVHDKKQVEKYLRDTIDQKIPAKKLKYEEVVFKSLGLIPQEFNYKDELINIYLSQLAGYYDPEKNHYVMAGWMPEMMQFGIAVHELVHAIQDQHFNLDDYLSPDILTSDEALARSALIEGDASLVMYDYMYELSGQAKLKDQKDVSSLIFQAVAGASMMDGFKDAPKSLQAFLLFPYTSGLSFNHYFLKKGDYQALNRLHKRLPKTTKEILHPELYEQNWKFKEITEQDVLDYFNLGEAEVQYQDRLGEFGVSTLISLVDSSLASAWHGDLVIVAKKGKEERTYWLTAWESSSKANAFNEVYQKVNPDLIVSSKVKGKYVGYQLK